MATIPAAAYISNALRTEGEVKQALEDTIASLRQVPGAAQVELTNTIAGGSITPAGSGGVYVIDTEAAAATDDLANVITTNIPDGGMILLRNSNSARSVVVKSLAGGAGQMNLDRAADYTLDDTKKWLMLQRRGSDWHEILRGPARMVSPVLAKSGAYTVAKEDVGKTITCTGTFTLTLLAAAQAGNGFSVYVKNVGTGNITIDPNSAELIDAQATIVLGPGQGGMLNCDATAWLTQGVPASAVRGHISGLTFSNNGTDPTNDIDVAVGEATSTHATPASRILLSLTTALTKRLDASWVTGTNQGGLSSSLTIGNNDYYIHAIRVAGVDDVGFDTSVTAANLVTDHSATHYRLIGWFKRVAGTIVAFNTYETGGGGLEFAWNSPTLDIDLANTLTTTRRTDAVKVPLNFSVLAKLNVSIQDSVTTSGATWVYCPDQADLAPSVTVAPLGNAYHQTNATGDVVAMKELHIRTSAAGLIAARSTVATIDRYSVSTLGFTWARRN